MGNFAIKKEYLIFKTVHPSPLSANRGFFGYGIFKKINDYLVENNLDLINW
jgi:uracil-DNA glycosylase